MVSKTARTVTVAQLERQLDALLRLCGEQVKKIDLLQRENARLKNRMALGVSPGAEGADGGG